MKLWQKSTTVDKKIEQFTIGKDRELDLRLAPFDIIGSIAHGKMLGKIGLLSKEEFHILQDELIKIYDQVQTGKFEIEIGVEDIHSQIEMMLTKSIGAVGKKIHSGRSRNDQVLLDLKLFFRSEIFRLMDGLDELIKLLLKQSDSYQSVLMPGYTHTQVAMVSSFGLWFGSFAESLIDDVQLLKAAYRIVNQNPLGSAAGYGSSFPLDRSYTTELLGFDDLNYNVIHAQMGRGKVELSLSYAMASIGMTIGKLATDICQYANQNYQFIKLPDHLTTGSSIMPHKKNPDVFELIRAKCNQMLSLPNEISLLINNLQSGYHRDFQCLKESIFPALDELNNCIEMTILGLAQMEVNPNILTEEKYKYLFTVEVVNEKVENGIPFRDAYKMVAASLEAGTFEYTGTINHQHEGSIGNLCNDKILKKWEVLKNGINRGKIDEKIKKILKK